MALGISNRHVARFFKQFVFESWTCRHIHRSSVLEKNVRFCLSDIGEGIREVTIKSWFVKPDDKVAQFDNICEVESDKATVTITSRYDGVITKLYHNVDDVALVGKPLVDIDVAEDVDVKSDSASSDSAVKSDIGNENTDLETESNFDFLQNKSLATPAVRRMAMEHGINLNEVKATGKNNRVLKEDVLSYIEDMSGATDNAIINIDNKKCEVKPIPGVVRAMIKCMTDSNSIPTFSYSDDIDLSSLVEMKSRIVEKHNIKMTYLPFIVKAVSKSLLKYPIINSSIHPDFKNIIYKSYQNISIAVDTPYGLVVPNIKNVERLTLAQISDESNRLKEKAFEGKLQPDDLADGTFTLSNFGAVGGKQGIPLILPPQVAIVAFGKIQKLPRFDEEDRLIKAHIMNMTYSADHRIVDGGTIARFSNMVKKYLESPELLVIDL